MSHVGQENNAEYFCPGRPVLMLLNISHSTEREGKASALFERRDEASSKCRAQWLDGVENKRKPSRTTASQFRASTNRSSCSLRPSLCQIVIIRIIELRSQWPLTTSVQPLAQGDVFAKFKEIISRRDITFKRIKGTWGHSDLDIWPTKPNQFNLEDKSTFVPNSKRKKSPPVHSDTDGPTNDLKTSSLRPCLCPARPQKKIWRRGKSERDRLSDAV